jgi:tetratricopeptide (TPR) repeat protein
MAKFDVFVGRKEELTLLNAWAEKQKTLHVVAVQGDGGVGKTWLQLEMLRRYGGQDDFAVVYFDMAEYPHRLLYRAMHLMQHLGTENFPRFQHGLKDLEHGYYDLPVLDAQAREQEVFQIGAQEINQLLENQRLIYMSDTLEMLSTEIDREVNRFARRFSNTLFIVAGRDMRERMPGYVQDFGADNVTYVELRNFDRVESDEFFEAVDEQGLISPGMRAKLHFLTDGRPVLLSLAVDWLSQDLPLPEITQRSMDDLQALDKVALHDLRARFEFELVGRVRRLKRPLDRAVLYMAHVNRRSDARTLATLLDVPESYAQELMEQLAALSFVRHNPTTGNCMLHDEMRNLVNRHAWPYVDPTGDVRCKLTRRVIEDYYEPRINELAQQAQAQLESDKGPVLRTAIGASEWEQWRLEAECLYYHLKISEGDGIAYFEDRFEDAKQNNHLMRIQFLLSEMESAGYTGIRDTLELRKAEALRLEGQAERASAICQTMLARKKLSTDNRISAHITLGWIAASTDPGQARQQYEAALELAQRGNKIGIMGVLHNNLGQLYLFTSQLDRAIEHCQQAIEYSKQVDNQPLMASARNNLAYIYRLQGNLSQADALCRVALAQRKRLGLERGLAYSYLTKGEIDRDLGDLESAERYTKLALRSFDKVSETRGQVMAYSSLANIRRHMEQYTEAEAYLEQGIKLAEQLQDEPLLADLLNVYGRGQRDWAVYLQQTGNADNEETVRASFQSAEAYLERSLELATQYGDQWLITRSQFELALAYFLSGSRSDQEVAALLDQVWESVLRLDDKLLQGYVQEGRGEIAQRQQDYGAAAQFYGLAAQLVAQRRGREPRRFFDRMGDRLLDPALSPQAAQALARGILDVLSEPAASESLASLRMLCQQVLDLQAL